MNIQINGEQTTIDRELTVAELLTVQKVKMPDMVSVELNGAIREGARLAKSLIAAAMAQ